MLIDARALAAGSELECDLCVVGSGPAGIAIADRLRNSPLRIVLLEAGGFNYELSTQALYRARIVGDPYFRLDACRWRMFGGGTNRWGGWCRPLDAFDYVERDWLPLSGWPIGAHHLKPYEDDAARLFELSNARFDLASWRERMAPPLVLDDTNFENVVIQHSPETNFAERYGPRVLEAPNVTTILHANVTEIRLGRESQRISELRAATLTGRSLVVRPNAVVLAAGGIENARLLLASRSDRGGGLGNEYDMVGRCFMEHLHVPMGHFIAFKPPVGADFYRKAVLENVRVRGVIMPTAAAQTRHRLLSASIGFERPSFSLGTPFLGWPPASMFAPVRFYRGLRSMGLMRVAQNVKQLAHGAYSMPNRWHSWRSSRRACSLASSAPAPGGLFTLYFRAEQAPDPSNRVILEESRRDALGVPQCRLEWLIRPTDVESVLGWTDLLKRDLHDRGVGEVLLPPENWRDGVIGGPHHMGTTRMSADPRRGVVDADCRVHSVENLYIAGSSVFATSGHANPTFTLVCLALRLADKLRERLAFR